MQMASTKSSSASASIPLASAWGRYQSRPKHLSRVPTGIHAPAPCTGSGLGQRHWQRQAHNSWSCRIARERGCKRNGAALFLVPGPPRTGGSVKAKCGHPGPQQRSTKTEHQTGGCTRGLHKQIAAAEQIRTQRRNHGASGRGARPGHGANESGPRRVGAAPQGRLG